MNNYPETGATPEVRGSHGQTAAQSSAPTRNQRRAPRCAHQAHCEVAFTDPDTRSTVTLRGQTANLSAEGVALRLPRPLPTGLCVKLSIGLADGSASVSYGVVMHQRRAASGVYEVGVRLDAEPRRP